MKNNGNGDFPAFYKLAAEEVGSEQWAVGSLAMESRPV